MKELFDRVSSRCSEITTGTYSTSFSLGIRCLSRTLRNPIYSIYGFVRLADEIVDSFHAYDKKTLFGRFRQDTFQSIEDRISLNPILNSFQHTVHQYKIEAALITQFLDSMEMDLSRLKHDDVSFKTYILGSAEVVGLMCLQVFCEGNQKRFDDLKPYAMSLGAAFQKINFLRDVHADYVGMGRTYFPGIEMAKFNDVTKKEIEVNIRSNFDVALLGIKKLPRSSRLGVYVAYVYYRALFKKIMNTPCETILKHRVSIRKREKARLLAFSFVKHQLHLL